MKKLFGFLFKTIKVLFLLILMVLVFCLGHAAGTANCPFLKSLNLLECLEGHCHVGCVENGCCKPNCCDKDCCKCDCCDCENCDCAEGKCCCKCEDCKCKNCCCKKAEEVKPVEELPPANPPADVEPADNN